MQIKELEGYIDNLTYQLENAHRTIKQFEEEKHHIYSEIEI